MNCFVCFEILNALVKLALQSLKLNETITCYCLNKWKEDFVTFLLIHKKIKQKNISYPQKIQIVHTNSWKVILCHSLTLLIVPRVWTWLSPWKTLRMCEQGSSRVGIFPYFQIHASPSPLLGGKLFSNSGWRLKATAYVYIWQFLKK